MRSSWTSATACLLSVTALAILEAATDPNGALKVAVVEWTMNGSNCVDQVLMGEKLDVKNSDRVMWIIHNGCADAILQVTLEDQKPVRFCRISPPSQQFTIDKPFTLGGGEAAVIKCEVHGQSTAHYKYRIRLWLKTVTEEVPKQFLSHELDIGVN